MPMTKAALAAELTNDPATLGYAAPKTVNDDVALAALLNDQTKGGTLTKSRVSAAELQTCVIASEFVALTPALQNLWLCLLTAAADGGVLTGNTNIVNQALAIWGTATATRANLTALRTRPGSRAEALWGEGAYVAPADVSNAIR